MTCIVCISTSFSASCGFYANWSIRGEKKHSVFTVNVALCCTLTAYLLNPHQPFPSYLSFLAVFADTAACCLLKSETDCVWTAFDKTKKCQELLWVFERHRRFQHGDPLCWPVDGCKIQNAMTRLYEHSSMQTHIGKDKCYKESAQWLFSRVLKCETQAVELCSLESLARFPSFDCRTCWHCW